MKTIREYTGLSTLSLSLIFFACAMTLSVTLALAADWPQWGHDPQHTGTVNVAGQNLNTILANIVYDPFVDQEKAPENGGGPE